MVIAKCTTTGRPRRCAQGNWMASAVQSAGSGCPMDLLFVAATVAFFAVSLAYVRGCDRL